MKRRPAPVWFEWSMVQGTREVTPTQRARAMLAQNVIPACHRSQFVAELRHFINVRDARRAVPRSRRLQSQGERVDMQGAVKVAV